MYGKLAYSMGDRRRRMNPHDQNRTARLEARIAPEALAVVRRAAEIQGRSISDFVVAAAQDAANRAIEETEIIRLSVAGQRQLAALLLNPPEPALALKKAFKRRRELLGVE
jgi:uncharacterized protein (DUF1778 family)